MNNEQITQEIRDLNDAEGRHECAIDSLLTKARFLEERAIPASVADVKHTLSGTQQIMADLAGTVHLLALQVTALTDRVTVLERVIDADLPPISDSV